MSRSAFVLVIVIIGACVPFDILADELPKFRQFPAAIYRGRVGRLSFSTPHAYSYRTRLREASHGSINFGGRYQVALWGCGTDCTTGAFIDATTGRVEFLPTVNTYEMSDLIDYAFKPIDYRLQSRLIVFAGQLNERGASGWHFYAVDGGELRHVMTKPYVANAAPPASNRATAKEEEERLASAERAARMRIEDEQRRTKVIADKAFGLIRDRMHDCFAKEVTGLISSGEASDVVASAIMTICSKEVDDSIGALVEKYRIEENIRIGDAERALLNEKARSTIKDELVALIVKAKAQSIH